MILKSFMINMDQTFGKKYKLCGKTSLDTLFDQVETVQIFPIKLVFRRLQISSEQKFVFIVPKKIVRAAHERNYLKRCMREIVRKNKAIFTTEKTGVNVGIMYQQPHPLPYKKMEQKLVQVLSMFANKLSHD